MFDTPALKCMLTLPKMSEKCFFPSVYVLLQAQSELVPTNKKWKLLTIVRDPSSK